MIPLTQDELVLRLIELIDTRYVLYFRLKNYYENFHKILSLPKNNVDSTRSDERVPFNYPRKIVQNYTGYMLGKPISYTSKTGSDDFMDTVDTFYSVWEKKHNVELKQLSEIYGTAYELSYINSDNEFKCAAYSPLEMIVVYDGTVENNVKLAVRKYMKTFDNTIYVDVYDDVNITHYTLDAGLVQIDQKAHYLGMCPVRELVNNDIRKSAFEDIIAIVDVYNLVNSLAASEIQDFKNAYLKVTGGATITLADAKLMRQMGIMQVPKGATIDWLIKKLDPDAWVKMLKIWQDEIYIQTNTVNLNENFQSNTSGVSIRMKLQELENVCSIKEAYFESLLKGRLKMFCNWLKQYKNTEFDYKDAAIIFTRNVPVDEESITKQVVMLQGIVPDEILLSWLPKITNARSAMNQLAEEQKNKTGLGLDTMFTTTTPSGG